MMPLTAASMWLVDRVLLENAEGLVKVEIMFGININDTHGCRGRIHTVAYVFDRLTYA